MKKNCIFKDSVPNMGGRVLENPNFFSTNKLGQIFQGRVGVKKISKLCLVLKVRKRLF